MIEMFNFAELSLSHFLLSFSRYLLQKAFIIQIISFFFSIFLRLNEREREREKKIKKNKETNVRPKTIESRY